MTTYKLNVKNASFNNVRFALYQEAPSLEGVKNVFSLAWFSKYAYSGANVEFQWQIDYSAVWSRPNQKLRPGVICKSSQVLPVDLNGPNKVALGYDKENDAFFFGPSERAEPGVIFTNCDASVPHSQTTPTAAAGIGIGMSGSGTFLVDTQPNLNLTWIPKPKYYLVAGNYRTGEILDVQSILGRSLEINFGGVTTVNARLREDNMLEIC